MCPATVYKLRRPCSILTILTNQNAVPSPGTLVRDCPQFWKIGLVLHSQSGMNSTGGLVVCLFVLLFPAGKYLSLTPKNLLAVSVALFALPQFARTTFRASPLYQHSTAAISPTVSAHYTLHSYRLVASTHLALGHHVIRTRTSLFCSLGRLERSLSVVQRNLYL